MCKHSLYLSITKFKELYIYLENKDNVLKLVLFHSKKSVLQQLLFLDQGLLEFNLVTRPWSYKREFTVYIVISHTVQESDKDLVIVLNINRRINLTFFSLVRF